MAQTSYSIADVETQFEQHPYTFILAICHDNDWKELLRATKSVLTANGYKVNNSSTNNKDLNNLLASFEAAGNYDIIKKIVKEFKFNQKTNNWTTNKIIWQHYNIVFGNVYGFFGLVVHPAM